MMSGKQERIANHSQPNFPTLGGYEGLAFSCRDCGARQVWAAQQQQWWYETAKGYVYATAVRCHTCRRTRRMAGGHITKILKATR